MIERFRQTADLLTQQQTHDILSGRLELNEAQRDYLFPIAIAYLFINEGGLDALDEARQEVTVQYQGTIYRKNDHV